MSTPGGKAIVVVGAGAAGIAAALALAEGGCAVHVLDAQKETLTVLAGWPEIERAAIQQRLQQSRSKLTFRQGDVFHAEPGGIWLHADGRAERLAWDVLVLATGSIPALALESDARWEQAGVLPETRLAAVLGCEHAYDASIPWLLPVRDETGATSAANVYLVGAAAGASNFESAIAGAERAAAAILDKSTPANENRKDPAPLWSWPAQQSLPASLAVCPCNGVTVADVRAAIGAGANTLHHLGQYGGAGAGHCRGRTCHLTLAHLLMQETGRPLDQVLTPPAEFPAVAVPLAVFAGITPERPTPAPPQLVQGVLR